MYEDSSTLPLLQPKQINSLKTISYSSTDNADIAVTILCHGRGLQSCARMNHFCLGDYVYRQDIDITKKRASKSAEVRYRCSE